MYVKEELEKEIEEQGEDQQDRWWEFMREEYKEG